jgi:hypothetical protein
MASLASSLLFSRNRGGRRGSVALRRLLFSSLERGETTTPFPPFPRWSHRSADASSAESVVAAGVMRKEPTCSTSEEKREECCQKKQILQFRSFFFFLFFFFF